MTHDHVINQIVDEFTENRIPGWCSIDKALDLAAVVIALRPKIIVEIGVFGGKSLLPMAMACESIGAGVVIGIDPWSNAASSEGYTGENAQWWGKLNHEEIYHSFMGNIARLALKNRVAIERAKSDAAAVPATIDLLHVDGQHTEQAIRDVNRFAANVRVGGIVCMDDINWTNDGRAEVAKAVDALKALGFVELYPSGTGAFFQRVSLPVPAVCAATRPARTAALAAPKKKKVRA
jgi:predicted O-methyltransferase YrrM